MRKRSNYKRQQRTIGAFVKVPFDHSFHTYARILSDVAFAFYDLRTTEDVEELERIASAPILFIIGVYNFAVTKGRWVKVGKLPLESHLQLPPPEFIQDPIEPTQFSIYENGKIRPAKREECEGLERAAVWEPRHVEERLRDHYTGRPNRWVEDMKIRDPGANNLKPKFVKTDTVDETNGFGPAMLDVSSSDPEIIQERHKKLKEHFKSSN